MQYALQGSDQYINPDLIDAVHAEFRHPEDDAARADIDHQTDRLAAEPALTAAQR
jgi:hypothetical protein